VRDGRAYEYVILRLVNQRDRVTSTLSLHERGVAPANGWEKSPSRGTEEDRQPVRALAPWMVAGVAGGLLFLVSWLRYLTFHSSAYDLAFFDQIVWNGARGHGLSSSFLPYPFLGQHFEPALFLFIPLYWLHASPLWLLGAQDAALAAAIVPLYWLSRYWLAGRWAPWVAITAYVLQLSVARAVGFDFHTETLAIPFVFLALLFLVRDRTWFLAGCAVVPMLCKEDGALVTLGIGLFAVMLGHRRAGLLLMAGSLAIGTFITLVVMPHLRGGAPGDLVERYTYLGHTSGQILLHLFTQPGLWLRHLVAAPAAPAMLVALLALGLLPFFRPCALLAALPALVISLLSSFPYTAGLRLQYGISATPLLVAAALLGWQKLSSDRRLPQGYGRPLGGAALLIGALATWLAFAPLPGGHGPDQAGLVGFGRVAAVERVLRRVPPQAPVAATDSVLTHLAERPVMFLLPSGRNAPWLVIDAEGDVSAESLGAGYASAITALSARGYCLEAREAGVSLWYLSSRPNRC